MSFQQKMETIQYIAALAITGTIISSYREKLHQKLSLEVLQQHRCYIELLFLQNTKITLSEVP